jgi:hypothetical protein
MSDQVMTGQTLELGSDFGFTGPPPSSTVGTSAHQHYTYRIRKASSPPNMVFDLSETLEGVVNLMQSSEGGQTLYEYVSCSAPATFEVSDRRLSEVIAELQELLNDAERGDWTAPSQFAFWNSLRTVTRAYATSELEDPRYPNLPAPVTSTDDSGGVRVTWRGANRTLVAKFGADASLRSYLYFEVAELHGLEPLNPRALSNRLRWLLEA